MAVQTQDLLHGLSQLKAHLESSVQVTEIKSTQPAQPVQHKSSLETQYLQVSPYSEQAHLLDLTTVSPPCQLLAQALTEMDSVRTDYATAAYQESFNWPRIYERLQGLVAADTQQSWKDLQSFYIVVFRSQVSPDTNRSHLGDLDKRSHAEATAGGGLLKYWFGTPDVNGRNLATCEAFLGVVYGKKTNAVSGIWRDQEDARCGGMGPDHRQAVRETRGLYLEWHIERLRLTVGANASSWSISDW